ncbi:MAG: filamentous hemagglutinin N-terminal domain-containing protein, partial [Cyanobacteria bacterium P01_F01_bin.53]
MPSLIVDKSPTYRCLGDFSHLGTLLFCSVVLGANADPATAQAITPSLDGTGTTVTQTGTQFDIEGGSLSANGDNLFHSFQDFQLGSGERATFLTTPFTQSVFARVRGGSPSLLDGELQLLGSDANLFFMNPAGIVFGPNATLNLPANFSATTADALGLGNHWFNATGANDYAALNDSVSAFAFTQSLPGSIVNGGKLALGEHHQLALVGGRVINTGTLSTPGGTVTIAAIPGENIARISTEGQLLTLDIVEENAKTTFQDFSALAVNSPRVRPLTIPELLTFSGGPEVMQLIENPDGTIRLSDSDIGIPVQSGTAIVSGLVDVSQPTAPGEVAVDSGS